MIITGYEAICNLGNNIDEIYNNAIKGNASCFDYVENYLPDSVVRLGLIKTDLPSINEEDYNLRCNRLLLKNLELLKDKIDTLLKEYSSDKIGIVVATTNSGTNEFEKTDNPKHFVFSNPSSFLKKHLNLKGYTASVSTACSSGIKAFSLACDLINGGVCDTVIVASVDSLSKVPVFGFHSLEVLSEKPSLPFSKNRNGMNIGEASAIFTVEKEGKNGFKIMGIGESSDIYHPTTPDPKGTESIRAIKEAIKKANITPNDVDYINAHGTGTIPNDTMEANAIYQVFSDKTPVSSTKPLTGHCLGAAAGIETALCLKLIENFDGRLYPNIYDGEYDENIPKINLVEKDKKYNKCSICMCNSFGFSGTNAIMIVGRDDEN